MGGRAIVKGVGVFVPHTEMCVFVIFNCLSAIFHIFCKILYSSIFNIDDVWLINQHVWPCHGGSMCRQFVSKEDI